MKIRNTLIAFLVAMLIALPLKIYQLLTMVDFSTGFSKNPGALDIILPLIVAAGVIACFVVALMTKRCPQYSPNVKSPFMGVVSGLTAAAIGWSAVADLFDAENATFAGNAGLIYSCLGLICVLAFLFPAVGFFMGINLVESRPVIMILPVLWMGMRMVLTFFDFTQKASIGEEAYDLVMMVFMLLFLLSAAKFLSGAAEKSAKMLFASGSSAALLAAVAVIPRYLLVISDADFRAGLGSVASYEAYRPLFVDLMLMIFAIGMMFYVSIPVQMPLPQRVPTPAPVRADAQRAPQNAQQPYQRQPQRMPYQQGGMNPMMGRPPYMQQPQRRVMQRPLPGAGPDAYTARGAGMRVAEDFGAISQMDIGETKYGGIDSFRENMLSGRRALEVLESSVIIDRSGEEDIIRPTFTEGDIAEVMQMDENTAELEQITEEISETLSSLFAQRDNTKLAPKEAVIDGASDEPAPVPAAPVMEEIREADYPPPPARRSLSLGSGRYDGRLADRLSEMEDRRARRGRAPAADYGYDGEYGGYEEDYRYRDPRRGYDGYEDEYEEYDGYGYEESDEYEDEYYDDDGYYDEVEYGTGEYYEYDEDDYDDDGYGDEYDEYEDDEYDEYDEYDDYGDSDDYDYDDEGYGAPSGGYNYWK